MKRSEIAFGLLRIPVDAGMVVLGFFLGFQLRLKFDVDLDVLPSPEEYQITSLTFAAFLIIVFAFFGLYGLKNRKSLPGELKQVFSHTLVWILVVMSYFFVIHELFFSRLALGFSVLFSLFLIITGRLLINLFKRVLFKFGIGQQHVLLIGNNKISKSIAASLKKDPQYKVVGQLLNAKNLQKMVRKHDVQEIIQTSQKLSHLEAHDILEYCQENHLDYRFVPDILEMERSNIEIEPIAGFPLIHLKASSLDGWGKVTKRATDIVLSTLALILLSPLFLLVAIGIKVDSSGPILFTKLDDGKPVKRIGQYGNPFKFYKFRTMRHKTHNQRYAGLAAKNIRKGPLVKIKNDPRITKFGRFLRRFDIDELPQLWNVLSGKMSLVGPRPHLPEEVDQYEKHHKFLLTIKPGITGLSQTSGRSDLDFEEEVKLDSYYIKHWSPLLDLKILLKTIMVVLRGHAAE